MCFALWIDRSIILMGEICNIKLDSLHFHTCFFSRSWHITWNTIFRSCDKLTGRVGATKQTRTPDLTLIRYSYTSSKVSAQHSAEQWKVTQGRRSNNPLGVCRTMGTIAPQIAAPSHVLLGHCTGLTSDTLKQGNKTFKRNNCSCQSPGLSQPCMCSSSTSCRSREILWHSWASQSKAAWQSNF